LLLTIGAVLAVGGCGASTTPARPPVTTRTVARVALGRRRGRSHLRCPDARGVRSSDRPAGGDGVPILIYHVINRAPARAPFPGLYVSAAAFAAQMRALACAGWHGVTMDRMRGYWRRGLPRGFGRPIVVSFDNGYESQYTHALPALRAVGWPGDLNIQLTGLPPSEGGLSDAQVRSLLAAGWELDTQGISHADLITLAAPALRHQVADARRILQARYDVPVNWFCYPSGHYDPVVVAAVRAAGYVGSTTVVPGWSRPDEDPYRLPRIRVLAGTSPAALLALIARDRSDAVPTNSYGEA
jgi:peptidoglycan/xylan/chitin deacetylase (PgdA/CDA1 family)